DDILAALDWAFSKGGDAVIGVQLTADAVPLGFQLSLIDEFRRRVTHALDVVAHLSPSQPIAEVRLNSAIGNLRQNARNVEIEDTTRVARAVELADNMGITKYRIEALLAMGALRLVLGDYASAIETAEKAGQVAKSSTDPVATVVADRIRAQAHHYQ